MTDLAGLVRDLRAELRQTTQALAELGVPAEVVIADACAGISDAVRIHARSGR